MEEEKKKCFTKSSCSVPSCDVMYLLITSKGLRLPGLTYITRCAVLREADGLVAKMGDPFFFSMNDGFCFKVCVLGE